MRADKELGKSQDHKQQQYIICIELGRYLDKKYFLVECNYFFLIVLSKLKSSSSENIYK